MTSTAISKCVNHCPLVLYSLADLDHRCESTDPVQNKILMRLATYINWDLIPFWLCDYQWVKKSHLF